MNVRLGCPLLQLALNEISKFIKKTQELYIFKCVKTRQNMHNSVQGFYRMTTYYATSKCLPMFLVLHSSEAQCSASVVWWWRNGSTTISTNQRIVLLTHSRPGSCQNALLEVCFSNTNLYSLVLRSQQTPFWNWSGK